jgi:hypothetical protein
VPFLEIEAFVWRDGSGELNFDPAFPLRKLKKKAAKNWNILVCVEVKSIVISLVAVSDCGFAFANCAIKPVYKKLR